MNFSAFFDVFRKGEGVADAVSSHKKETLTVALSGLFVALNHLAQGYGYALLSDSDAAQLGLSAAVLVSVLFHFAVSPDVGLLPSKPVTDSAPSNDLSGGA